MVMRLRYVSATGWESWVKMRMNLNQIAPVRLRLRLHSNGYSAQSTILSSFYFQFLLEYVVVSCLQLNKWKESEWEVFFSPISRCDSRWVAQSLKYTNSYQ